MENPVFSKSDCIEHYQWGDDCHGWAFIDDNTISVKQELMPPNTSEKLHYHEKATQFFFILIGRATFFINGKQEVLNPRQGIKIKAGQKHYISNLGEVDLEFILYSNPSSKNDRINVE